jgi:hypothetical protein
MRLEPLALTAALMLPTAANTSTGAGSSRTPATASWREFASVIDAVRCAAEIQRGMADRRPDAASGRHRPTASGCMTCCNPAILSVFVVTPNHNTENAYVIQLRSQKTNSTKL